MSDSNLDFFAIASHELRTPITIIRGFAELLQDQPNLKQETIQDISEKILRHSLRLEKLIKSLLILADVENAASISFEQAPILPCIKHCKEIVLAKHPEAHIVIECTDPKISAAADVDLLELAIINLLENAIKYSQEDGKINICISSSASKTSIAIQDQGIGIAPEHIPHIFDRFYSADKARSRKLGGAGLGLSLVKTIIEKHGGSIAVQSVQGQGSVFTIVLPNNRCSSLTKESFCSIH